MPAPTVTAMPVSEDRRVLGEVRAIRPGWPGREIEVATDFGDVFMSLYDAPRAQRIHAGERVWLSLWRQPALIEPAANSASK